LLKLEDHLPHPGLEIYQSLLVWIHHVTIWPTKLRQIIEKCKVKQEKSMIFLIF
jgi:hypothetical protein